MPDTMISVYEFPMIATEQFCGDVLHDSLSTLQARGAHMGRVVGDDGDVLGLVALEDPPREGVREALEATCLCLAGGSARSPNDHQRHRSMPHLESVVDAKRVDFGAIRACVRGVRDDGRVTFIGHDAVGLLREAVEALEIAQLHAGQGGGAASVGSRGRGG